MAADRLFGARNSFVERVSRDIIRQLLDDLLEAEVLNYGEVEAVQEENHVRAAMARSLIDSVRRKGDQASQIFSSKLHVRDPMLCENLGLQPE